MSEAASEIDIIKRVILLSVTVIGSPFLICSRKIWKTDPLEPITLPKRTIANLVLPRPRYELAFSVNLSANNLLAPNVLVGFVALSVLIKINLEMSSKRAASKILLVPVTFVFTASNGFCSQISICFIAAA